MESGFKSESRYSSGPDWQPITHHGSGHYEFFKVRYFGALHFVKRPTAEFRHDLMTIESLKKEFLIGYNLNHPNIARYMKLEDGAVYEEFIDGYSLREMIERDDDRLKSPEFLRRICRQLLEATSYLHSRGVIHNDIKPENVMVARIGDQLKLVDLGAATSDMWDATEGYTLEYKAPEQGTDSTNVQTDIYLIGKLMQELSSIAGDYHRWKNFISKATAENPSDRFQSDLEATAAIPDGKRTIFWSFLAILILILGAGAIWMLWSSHDKEPASNIKENPTITIEAVETDSIPSTDKAMTADESLQQPDTNTEEERTSSLEAPKSTVDSTLPADMTLTQTIEYELKRFAIDKYKDLVYPECRRYGDYIFDIDRRDCDSRIEDQEAKADKEINNFAETLCNKYPEEADYCRMEAALIINAQHTEAQRIRDEKPVKTYEIGDKNRPLYNTRDYSSIPGEKIARYVNDNAYFDKIDGYAFRWLANHIKYPPNAKKNRIQGRVIIEVIIEKDGSVSHPFILKGIDPELDKEALRLASIMPKWESPAKLDGIPVRAPETVEVYFGLP